MKRVASLLLSLSVVAFAGIGVADSGQTLPVTTQAFDSASGVLTAQIPGGATGEFRRTNGTIFLPADIAGLPPGPCRGLAIAWDVVVFSKMPAENKRKIANALMTQMAKRECAAVVTIPDAAPASDDAPEMLSFKPGK